MTTKADVREFVLESVRRAARARGVELSDFGEALDLLDSGLFDSMGYIGLVTAIEDRFGVEIDFASLDPEQMVRVDGLVAAAVGAIPSEMPA
jgi:acyl carrier protein